MFNDLYFCAMIKSKRIRNIASFFLMTVLLSPFIIQATHQLYHDHHEISCCSHHHQGDENLDIEEILCPIYGFKFNTFQKCCSDFVAEPLFIDYKTIEYTVVNSPISKVEKHINDRAPPAFSC
jgi:hypothetical protein